MTKDLKTIANSPVKSA